VIGTMELFSMGVPEFRRGGCMIMLIAESAGGWENAGYLKKKCCLDFILK
jgi:hypothetical protein